MDRDLQQWTAAAVETLAPGTTLEGWQALAVEASQRRFYRLQLADGHSLVAMRSPPQLENNAQFEALAGVFGAAGVAVPEVLAVDRDRGFFVMTDLGPLHLADVYRRDGVDRVMPAALDTLHRLQQVDSPGIPPYTRERFADELGIYMTWCLEALLERRPDGALDESCAALLAATDRQPRCCVHRDYHGRNLLSLEDGRVGVVDFQDALMGPATYDLASLLRDCYHRFSEAEVARWRDAYLRATPLDVDRAGFARDLDFVALQRQLKAVGIFARLHLRDGRDSHLPHIVPVLERIAELAATYPELDALARHAADVLPAARRRLAAAA